MKYLFNISLLSILFLFAVGCQEEEQDILALEREAFISNNDFEKSSDQERKAFLGKINPEMLIQFLDKDKDGRISQEEAGNARKKKLSENFDLLDGNNDGFIDEGEINKLASMAKGMKDGKPNPKMLIQFLDKDKDGRISQGEAGNARKKKLSENFGLLDENNDGFIDEGEITKLSTMAKGMKVGKPNQEMLIQFLDTNKDGKIDREEIGKARKKKLSENFDFIDSNKNGFLEEEEITKAIKK